jgi:hypothetical protein
MTNNHGGRRPNSGRKAKPETVTISFRVLKEKAEYWRVVIAKLLKGIP